MKTTKHFLSLLDFTPAELEALLRRAIELKQAHKSGQTYTPLQGKSLAMIFEKSSTRTRVSFELAMVQLGGHAVFLLSRDTQLGRGELIEDSARVLNPMTDGVVLRTFGHDRLVSFAQHSEKPVINGLTDRLHPCQLLADMMTYIEKRETIKNRTVAWIGDGNNMCHSYINAARQFNFNLRIACPQGFSPDSEILQAAQGKAILVDTPQAAAENADLIVTDVWASMGQEKETDDRLQIFSSYQVDTALMQCANKDALFMHCLPAHRGEEVSTTVLESQQSVVWEEAENRLHAQKALLEFLLVE